MRFIAFFLMIFAALTAGCSYPDRALPLFIPETRSCTGIEIVAPAPVMAVGDSMTLRVLWLIADGTRVEADPRTARWSLSGEGVATIDVRGLVVAAGEGPVRIEAALGDFITAAEIEITDRRGLVLSEVFYDAEGADDGLEFIEVENRSSRARSLAGLELTDGTEGRAFVFPEGSVLAPGAKAVVAQSCDGFAGRFGARAEWCGFAFVLNNSGETVTLRSPAGAVIDRVYIKGGCGDYPAGPEWGSAVLPEAPAGQSVRRSVNDDTDSFSDWERGAPDPGR